MLPSQRAAAAEALARSGAFSSASAALDGSGGGASLAALAAGGGGAFGGGGGAGGMPGLQASQQATRHARRVYCGGLPPTATEHSLGAFLSHALVAIGGNVAGTGNAVLNVYHNREKSFAFVEMRTGA